MAKGNLFDISTSDRKHMPAEYFQAANGDSAAVIMITGIFGLRPGVRETIDEIVSNGFSVLVPDLFFRTVPGPLADHGEEQARALTRYKEFDAEQGMKDLTAAIEKLRQLPGHNGKIAAFGYCFGGRYAYLSLARCLVDGAVSLHGTKIGLHLDEASQVRGPIQIHVGDKDSQIPMEEVERIRAALAPHADAKVFVYSGLGHGFTDRGRACYDAAADAKSLQCALELLRTL